MNISNVNEVYSKLKLFSEAVRDLQTFLLNYESTLGNREGEVRVLDAKIAAKKKENEEAESRASLIMAKAGEEAAQMRHQAQEIFANAQAESVRSKALAEEARVAIQEAKARSAKVEADEKALQANTIIHERKKKAIEDALHVG